MLFGAIDIGFEKWLWEACKGLMVIINIIHDAFEFFIGNVQVIGENGEATQVNNLLYTIFKGIKN